MGVREVFCICVRRKRKTNFIYRSLLHICVHGGVLAAPQLEGVHRPHFCKYWLIMFYFPKNWLNHVETHIHSMCKMNPNSPFLAILEK